MQGSIDHRFMILCAIMIVYCLCGYHIIIIVNLSFDLLYSSESKSGEDH